MGEGQLPLRPPILPHLLLVTGNASHLILIKPLNVPPGGGELVRRLIVTKNTPLPPLPGARSKRADPEFWAPLCTGWALLSGLWVLLCVSGWVWVAKRVFITGFRLVCVHGSVSLVNYGHPAQTHRNVGQAMSLAPSRGRQRAMEGVCLTALLRCSSQSIKPTHLKRAVPRL